jgi:hypothetical protein
MRLRTMTSTAIAPQPTRSSGYRQTPLEDPVETCSAVVDVRDTTGTFVNRSAYG